MKSFIQSICGAPVSASLGLSSIAKNETVRRSAPFAVLAILACVAAKDVSFSEKDIFEPSTYSSTPVKLQVQAPVISLLDAKQLADDKGAAIYQVSTSSSHDLTGLNSYLPSEYESLRASFVLEHSHDNIENIILVSDNKSAAFEMANNLSGLLKNVFIVDSSVEAVVPQLDSFFNSNVPTSLSTPISQASINITASSLYNELSGYTVIKLTSGNILEKGMYPMNMTFDTLSLMLSDMKELAKSPIWDHQDKIMFLFPNGYSQDNMKQVSEYILAKIESAGGKVNAKSAEYMTTDGAKSLLSHPTRTENFLTNPIPAIRSELTATDIQVAINKYEEISLVCVAKKCSNSAFNIKGLHPADVTLSTYDGRLNSSEFAVNVNKDRPLILISDDLGTLNLAKIISSHAYLYDILPLGIATTDTLDALANGTAEINTISFALDTAANYLAPDMPLDLSTFTLIAVGFMAAMLLCAPYKSLKILGAFTFTYTAYYHQLWINGSHIEYAHYISMLASLFMLGTLIFSVRKDKTTKSTIHVFLLFAPIYVLFIYVMEAPVDKLAFGLLFGLNLYQAIKGFLKDRSKTGSNIKGETYLKSAPMVTGFKGYVVGYNKVFGKLALKLSRKWIIYHNHTTIYGSNAGGFNGFTNSTSSKVNDDIRALSTSCIEAGVNEKDIQFWVLPTPSNELYRGTVCSHSVADSLSWNYTLINSELVEDGELNSVGRDICRTELPTSWVEWQLYYKLKRAELEHGKAVELSVHISKRLKLVRVVSVKIKEVNQEDESALLVWRSKGSKAYNRSPIVYDCDTAIALNQICNGAMVFGLNNSYQLTKQEDVFDVQVAHRCMTQIQALLDRKDLTRELAIKEMTEYFAPVLRMRTTSHLTLSGFYQDIMMDAIEFCKKYAPAQVTAEEKAQLLMFPPPSSQLIVKYLLRMAATTIKRIK